MTRNRWIIVGGIGLVLLVVVASLIYVRQAPHTVKSWSALDKADTSLATVSGSSSVEVGLRFSPIRPSTLVSIKFLKAEGSESTHEVHVWSSDGALLTAVTSTNESPSGWQQVALTSPIPLRTNTMYTVSYHTTRYVSTPNFFTKATVNGPINTDKDAGVYHSSAQSAFPTDTDKSSNYWVDVVLTTDSQSTTTAVSAISSTTSSASSGSSASSPTTSSDMAQIHQETTTSTTTPGTSTTSTTSAISTTTSTIPPITTTVPPSGFPYPDRFSVGAPGVGHYTQTDAHLPVPSGYSEISPPGGEYDIYDCSSPVHLDHIYLHGFIYIGMNCHGTVTITNSILAPPPGTTQRTILNNSTGNVTLDISDTTVRPEPVPLGGTNAALTDHFTNSCGSTCHVTLSRLDVSNSGGMCLCEENTKVEYSWLHDLYIAHLADPSLAHTGGVFPYGGNGPVEVSHNRLEPGFNVGTGNEVTNYWQAITAVLFTQSAGGSSLHGYNVHDNFISLGAFDMGLEDGSGIIVHNNVFGPSHWGETTTCSSGCTVTYADWSNNVKGDINGNPTGVNVPHP